MLEIVRSRSARRNFGARISQRSLVGPAAAPPSGIVARLDALAAAPVTSARSIATDGVEAEITASLTRVLGRATDDRSLSKAVATAFPVLEDGSVPTSAVLRTVEVGPSTVGASPAQAVLLDATRAAVARARPLLRSLEPRSGSVDSADIDAYTGSIVDALDDLLVEVARFPGPRGPFVTVLLDRLNESPLARNGNNGALADLELLLTAELVVGTPVPQDARQYASMQSLYGVVDDLWSAWETYVDTIESATPRVEQVLERSLVRARQLLDAVVGGVAELFHGLDAVGLTAGERTLFPSVSWPILVADDISYPLSPPGATYGCLGEDFTLEDLLDLLSDFAGPRTRSALERLGQVGLEDVADEADVLFGLLTLLLVVTRRDVDDQPAVQATLLADARVDAPLDFLHDQLQAIADLAGVES